METKQEFAYASFAVPERTAKPRKRGLSMMIDWGMGVARQRDTLESAGAYIDFAKVAAGISRFLPKDVLTQKLATYREFGVSTSPGGAFAELAFAQRKYPEFVDETVAIGYDSIEVSDNLLHFEADEKAACIARAKQAGLKVFGEVGKKEGSMNDDEIVTDVHTCLQAGADWVYLEAVELFTDGQIRGDLIARLQSEFGDEKLIYELPVVILHGMTRDYKHKVTTWLVRTLGTEVNLANLEWDELYIAELVRRGFAGDTSHPQGAYRLAGIETAEF
ncbi:phosphosulfolactate synthase [Paraburkholderia sp. SG-MS1]|uniref:phosphosulfolactate synthase n=1 Tax=Paraburkholderia sp. SG-MS1 TaxID=2023741 RepID=UPI001447F6DD|nr:phosphosulfolactate synthase [Paraburkholderia sp. SG-MS1]